MSRALTREHIAEDRRHPGTQRHLTRVVPADVLGAMATSAASVPADGEIRLDADLEATGLDVVVSGVVSFPWEGDCRRCLEPVAGTVETPVQEVFTPHPVEGETWGIEADSIDLGPVLHDAVLLSLPLVPLCSADCRGPDPSRFPTTVEGTLAEGGGDRDDGDDEAIRRPDPRWAALDALTFDRGEPGVDEG